MLSINKSECIMPLGNFLGQFFTNLLRSDFIFIFKFFENLLILLSIVFKILYNDLIDKEFFLLIFSFLVALCSSATFLPICLQSDGLSFFLSPPLRKVTKQAFLFLILKR